jgi:hypothetical protein
LEDWPTARTFAAKLLKSFMKMRIAIPVLLSLGLLAGGCTTDFTLEGDWQDIPVVYAFLSTQDTAHYVRVEKVFLEPGGNAENIARIPDSLYYGPDEATVILERVSNGQRVVLQRVNGEDEGYPRQPGVFASSPNILYKVRASQFALTGGQQVRIIIERPGEEPAIAETTIVAPVNFSTPSEGSFTSFLPYGSGNNITWSTSPQAFIYDVRIKIRYKESLPGSTTEFVDKSIEWVITKDHRRNEETTTQAVRLSNVSFFQTLADNIPQTPGVIRRFTGMDYTIIGAGREIVDFLEISNANTGITSSEIPPTFSNVTNGLGLVSSKSKAERFGITLSSDTRDSLRNGTYTKLLNFVP